MLSWTFPSEFSISKTSYSENLPFDTNHKTFSIKQAREHIEVIEMMNHHTSEKHQQNELLNNAEINDDCMDGKIIGDDGGFDAGDNQNVDHDDDGVIPHTEQEIQI